MTVVHDFEGKSKQADSPAVRERAEGILATKIEARSFEWTERGGQDDRRGVDVWCRLPSRKRVGVDVKDNAWGEVRLEYVSREGEGRVGWTVDDSKETDYVLNLWPRRFWLIDFPCLKAVAKANRERYMKHYAMKNTRSRSDGGQWRTLFIPVPVGILLSDIYGQTVMGTPLTAPRTCPSCKLEHPVGTTCAGGWAEWP